LGYHIVWKAELEDSYQDSCFLVCSPVQTLLLQDGGIVNIIVHHPCDKVHYREQAEGFLKCNKGLSSSDSELFKRKHILAGLT
jgi:hypothetical protein